ncbi:hypothetical protein [Edaphobacter modestus]|uniref:Uncharacterized protein n=1 Tax=Edaphobacter modestus TaxID=388466 RepID=A0A4Q7YYN3_9BACT|nr:hypothetical protein [Edaphobacter modestus]RZU42997.1 hypothetical protein BDD14_4598 [Edaphobacter modestus]
MKFLPQRPALLSFGLLCLLVCPLTGWTQNSSSASPRRLSRTTPGGRSVSRAADGVVIPGPLRSFLRMAGISQKIPADEVLPLLSRNVFMQGYSQQKPTEFLILLDRYVQQARELQILAGSSGTINVMGCADVGTLIQILGYRVVGNCHEKNLTLATSDPDRAFLTIDSGFPLITLEESLQKGVEFHYPFPSARVPVLLKESDWMALNRKRSAANLIDLLIRDPGIARLYWALSRNDDETNLALAKSPGLWKMSAFAPVLDFYGSQISIRSGRVMVPGGSRAEPVWKDLAGASPENPGEFVMHLISKDNGWLAAYYDALSRVSQTQQEHLTEPARMRHVYEAFRSPQLEPASTASVFRKAPGLLVLFTRVEWDPDGKPHVPGGLDVWKEKLAQKSDFKVVRTWGKHARNWNDPEQLLEAMASISRLDSDTGPLQTYLTLSEIDARRPAGRKLSPEAARLLAARFQKFGTWYLLFSEFPELTDESIARFINVAESIGDISNAALRGNTVGAFQANIGIWQILARQEEIPVSELNASWMNTVGSFAKITSSMQLFDAARSSLADVVRATGAQNLSQEALIALMAGPPQQTLEGQQTRDEIAGRIRNVFEDQRLVSLNTLFSLSDGLASMAQGSAAPANMLGLAGELHEFEMPRPIFTNSEKISWAPGVYSTHHAELQIKTDLTKVIKGPGTKVQLEAARGQLTPFLRDALVGLNYAYYEPPGAQVLHNNSLFVRAHDFSGLSVVAEERSWLAPELMGVGTPAGGGAYLMGSLADLPYALAATEQDFIAPENVQALIWKELVPDLLVSATVPRWWSVSPQELHAVTLYLRSGEELLLSSEKDPALRAQVTQILADRMAPQRLETLDKALANNEDAIAVLAQTMPADTFYLAAEFRRRYPGRAAVAGSHMQQLDALAAQYPADTSVERLSRDFGVPHPVLARSYAPKLLYVKPFPSFGGESSRLFGESWESSNLYWASLADEKGYQPATLNRLVPELTRRMTAKIFATDLEDWPALHRAMQEAGEEFRQGKVAPLPMAATAGSLQAPGGQPQETPIGGVR